MSSNKFVRGHAIFYGSLFLFALAIQPAQSEPIVHAPNSTFWDTGMRLCDVDANGNCNDSSYALSIARYGFGGAVAALLALLVFLIFIPARFLCNGFGGKKASHGCCPPSKYPREYSRNEVLAVKIAVLLVVIPVVIGVAIGYQSNANISSSVQSITSSLVKSGDDILQSLLQLKNILLSLSITSGDEDTINSVVDTATSIDLHMHNARDSVNKYDQIRNILMIVGFAFSLSLVAAGVMSVVFNMRPLALILGLIGLLVLTTIWISFGIHLVADKFVYDVCVDINLLTDSSNSSSILKTGALANLWDCGDNSEFVQLQSLVQMAMTKAVSTACTARSNVCFNATNGHGDPNWQCAASPICGANTLSVVTDSQHMSVLDGGQLLSVSQCALSCTDKTNKNISTTIVDVVAQYNNFTNIYNETVLPLLSCQFATDVIAEFRNPLCSTLFNSLYGVAVSNLIVGIFYVAFIILMIVGYKRFESSDNWVV